MTIERRTGSLESIDLRPGRAHAFVRMGDELVHLCMINRGVLQADGTISRCIDDSRYQPIETPLIELDVNFDAAGQKPHVVLWAPKKA